uniref:Proline dehydrogenase n=1 Tax=Chromera velia CCMP2878 TaxID=1169474 RepID=A0A0G4GI73_9ALVE|eukprot:Cvel_22010.t1-p1 / transcript=Cvel_22010.t1 / gene=Cvel_22010 / organism=Chromera_velia_CCMP2878 / gene_product=Proline dehydrogenase 1, mitochondrial, putative / transcript_product=Proline dehydrogenase 1, mitochondrial, putative / location=Cvel_scaffold2122:23553-25488(-) / protein_length=562 / sequence_SO=supercontig / SO=protein_coding / is_pseudo=false
MLQSSQRPLSASAVYILSSQTKYLASATRPLTSSRTRKLFHSENAEWVPGNRFSSKLDFNAHQIFAAKSSSELLRALAIQSVCKIKPLVRNANALISASRAIAPSALVGFALKHTFFSHFCGGTSLSEIQKTIHRLESSGVGSILDYAAEADVGHLVEGSALNESLELNCANSISAVHACSHQATGYTALKVTSMTPPEVLMKASTLLKSSHDAFLRLCTERAITPGTIPLVREDDFVSSFERDEEQQARRLFSTLCERAGRGADDRSPLTYGEWMSVFSPLEVLPEGASGVLGIGEKSLDLTDSDREQLAAGVERLHRVASVADGLGNVRVLVDAEQSYMQSAIDWMANGAAARFNRGGRAVVMNTYQCYLKDASTRLVLDLQRAEAEGWLMGAKLVRGAYMEQERRLAAEGGTEDPIHPTKEATHACFDACAAELIRRLPFGAEVLLGTHNEDSILKAVGLMKDLGLPLDTPGFAVAQLLGMCDHVTFGLAAHGCRAFKYVPYGPVLDVLPYLLRRAEENSDLLGTGGKEMRLMGRALMSKVGVKFPSQSQQQQEQQGVL